MSALRVSASVPVITHHCANVGTVPKVALPLNERSGLVEESSYLRKSSLQGPGTFRSPVKSHSCHAVSLQAADEAFCYTLIQVEYS